MGLGPRQAISSPCATGSPKATVSDDEVLLLWRALSAFRSGAGLGCRPEGSPPRSQCPLVDRCPSWRGPDDRLLSLEETIEETERRRTAWPCSRLLDLLGPETRRISRDRKSTRLNSCHEW